MNPFSAASKNEMKATYHSKRQLCREYHPTLGARQGKKRLKNWMESMFDFVICIGSR